MSQTDGGNTASGKTRWYEGISRYQWLVLLIASLGWIFDVFEGQIFVASMKEAMPELLPAGSGEGVISYYNNIALASFLLGGAFGGILFGMLSDRIGRVKTMVITILVYSLFTCVTALAQGPWQLIGLRFFVAMGVGGEWAVASTLVAEVFPARARPWSGAIFHASSVFGTYLAILAGALVVNNPDFGWRWGFLIGALPALLTIWVRMRLKEPEKWKQARQAALAGTARRPGRIDELFSPDLVRGTLVGVSLAAVGLATFWGVHIYGKDLMRLEAERTWVATDVEIRGSASKTNTGGETDVTTDVDIDVATDATMDAAAERRRKHIKSQGMLGMFLTTTGGGIGLLAFGPLCQMLGRRLAFLLFHIGGLASGIILFGYLETPSRETLYVALPIFGFLSLGMHAGYAVYFPELFPTRLRGTGAGFCFNCGRILAAPILVLTGYLQKPKQTLDEATGLMEEIPGYTLNETATLLSFLFLLGIVVLIFAPETKDRELPE